MAAPSYSDVLAFSRQVQSVSAAARAAFERELAQVGFDDWAESAEQVRRIAAQIDATYGAASGNLGAQWFEYCAKLALGRAPVAKVDVDTPMERSVNAQIDKLFDGKADETAVRGMLANAVESAVSQRSRDTVKANVADQPRALRRYARVTTGDACAFCVLMASQGAVYTSESAASDDYHDNCTCVAVPFADAASIPGYGAQLQAHKDAYSDADRMRRHPDEMPEDLKARIADAKAAHSSASDKKWTSLNETLVIMRYNEGLS